MKLKDKIKYCFCVAKLIDQFSFFLSSCLIVFFKYLKKKIKYIKVYPTRKKKIIHRKHILIIPISISLQQSSYFNGTEFYQ